MQKITEKERVRESLAVNSNSLAELWLPFVFFVLAFLIYSNTLFFNKYVLDDQIYTIENSDVQRGISAFPDLVSKNSLGGLSRIQMAPDYRPLVILNFALEKSLFGNSPEVNHFFNVLCYALLCALLFIFLRKLFKNYPVFVPAVITALFVFHPLHTEVVANIKSRDELLCMLFGFLSLNFIFDYQQRKKPVFLILSCIAFFLCPLAKESGFAYAALIPLVIYFFTNASLKRIVLLTIPFAAISCILILIRMNILHTILINKPIAVIDNSLMAAANISDRLATSFTMLLYALRLFFFPFNLSYDYSYNQFPIVHWNNASAILSLTIYTGLTAIALWGLKKRSVFSFAILFYFFSYFITSNLVVKFNSSFGERFLFAPSIAFCVSLPFLLAGIFKIDLRKATINNSRPILITLAVIFLLFAFRTFTRNYVWQDNLTLILSGLETSPNSFHVHQWYAQGLSEKAKGTDDPDEKKELLEKAIPEFKKSLNILPKEYHTPEMYNNIGVMYYEAGETDSAISMYEKTLRMDPNQQLALVNYGIIFSDSKEYSKALIYLRKADEIKPGNIDILANIGTCYFYLNDYKNAEAYFDKALQLNYSNIKILNFLAATYANSGDTITAKLYKLKADSLTTLQQQ